VSDIRRIYLGPDEVTTPSDLCDGEVVDAVQLGGSADGVHRGRFRVELRPNELWLHRVEGAEWLDGDVWILDRREDERQS